MTPGWAGGVLALALAAPVAASAAGRIAIDHARVECVPYDRYTRIAGARADGVVSAQLQFRPEGGGGRWYSIAMAAEGSQWTAVLPRPIRPLSGLEYRIVTRSSGAGEEAGAAIAVRVGGDAECARAARSTSALAAPIVVRVPEGAPVVPPVPAGFSPAGVVAAAERARTSARTLAIGAGLAGGITAAVALGPVAAREPRDISELPAIAFSGTAPPPGTVLSLSRGQLSVFVLLTGRTGAATSFFWVFELLGAGVDTVCVSMNGRAILSSLPATVTLEAPLTRRFACGDRFDVDRSRLRVTMIGRPVFDEIQAPLPFHFEP
jgi:hypothetical protein